MRTAPIPTDDLDAVVAQWRGNRVTKAAEKLNTVSQLLISESHVALHRTSESCDGCLEHFARLIDDTNRQMHWEKLTRKGRYETNGRLLCSSCDDWENN